MALPAYLQKPRGVKGYLATMPPQELEAIRDWVRLHEDKPEEEVVRSLAVLWYKWFRKAPHRIILPSDHDRVVRELKATDRTRQKLGKANAKLMDQVIVLKRDLAIAKRAARAALKTKTKK